MSSKTIYIAIFALLAVLSIPTLALKQNANTFCTFATGVNVTVNGQVLAQAEIVESGLSFRETAFVDLDFYIGSTPVLGGLYAESVGVRTQVTSGGTVAAQADAEVDVFTVGGGIPYTASANWDVSVYLSENRGSNASFSASGAASMIATWPVFLVEVDASGNDVVVYDISSLSWRLAGLVSSSSLMAATSLSASLVTNPGTITIAAQTAAQLGISTYGGVNLIPKTWSLLIEISNYLYANSANSLRIVYATATGSATMSESGTLTFSPGQVIQAYADLGASASVATTNGAVGTTVTATVVTWESAGVTFVPPSVATQLNAVFHNSFYLYIRNVTLAANAGGSVSIPVVQHSSTIGTGTRVNEAANISPPSGSSSSLKPVILLVSLAVLALLF